jgi:hypothetical protein
VASGHRGRPGVGKTSLVRRSLARISGLRVLSARAGQAEADLDFGIVDQLLRAAGSVFPPFPPARETETPASSFAVGARLLEVVGEQQAVHRRITGLRSGTHSAAGCCLR